MTTNVSKNAHGPAADLLVSRRNILQATIGSLLLVGCSRQARVEQPVAMAVHRDPSCGCCEQWAVLANQAGFRATVSDEPDMPALKRRLGVPESLASCHTTVLDRYVIEGHVPLDAVRRLLRDRPSGIRGLAVPGMPAGSPGMEVPDGRREAFDVIAFDAAGRASIFQREPGSTREKHA